MSDDEEMGGSMPEEREEGEDEASDMDGGDEEASDAPAPPPELPEGVKKEILERGEGWQNPKAGDEVEVHYVGTLASDGSQFDSSRDRGQPFTFTLGKGQVIQGWDLGVATMLKGEKAKFTLEAKYAYGSAGSPPKIPAEASLVFEVELLSWVTKDDLFGDEGAIKTTVEEGTATWNHPKEGGEVLMSYRVVAKEGGATIEEKAGIDYVLGSGALGDELGRVVDKALLAMSKGEKCSVACAPDYVYKSAKHGATVVELHLQQMYSVSDVSLLKDGSVMKKLVREGDGYDKPQDGCKVTLKVESAKDEAGASLPGFSGPQELAFEAGKGEVCDALESAVREMKKGERALLTSKTPSKAAEAKLGLGDTKAAQVVFDLDLSDFAKAVDVHDLPDDEKVGSARKRKADGAVLFSAKRFELALEKYKKVIDDVSSHDSFEGELKTAAAEVKMAAELNKAACFLHLSDAKGALESCDKVLKEDKSNVKALFRRAKARHARTDHMDALRDVRRVLELDPKNAEARALLQQVQRSQKLVDRTSKDTFARMCKGLGNLGADRRTAAAAKKADEAEDLDGSEDGGGGDDDPEFLREVPPPSEQAQKEAPEKKVDDALSTQKEEGSEKPQEAKDGVDAAGGA